MIETTRRAFFAGSAAATVAASIPVVAAVPAAPADREHWDAAMAEYEQAKAEDVAFDAEYWRTHNAWEAGRPAMPDFDAGEFSYLCRSRAEIARTVDLDECWRRFLDGENRWWFAKDADGTKARHRAALDRIQEFRDAEAAHGRDSGMDAAEDRWNDLGERATNAAEALMAMPAPDLAALRWKLDYLTDGGTSFAAAWSDEFAEQTLSDVALLLPEGR